MEHPAGANLRVSQSRADTGIRPPYAVQSSRFGANGTNALFESWIVNFRYRLLRISFSRPTPVRIPESDSTPVRTRQVIGPSVLHVLLTKRLGQRKEFLLRPDAPEQHARRSCGRASVAFIPIDATRQPAGCAGIAERPFALSAVTRVHVSQGQHVGGTSPRAGRTGSGHLSRA